MPVRSASRIRTSPKEAPRRSAPASPTNDQSPPTTFRRLKAQSLNTLPTNLHPVKVASKNEHRMKVQFANAASECTEALNRTFRKVHSEKAAP